MHRDIHWIWLAIFNTHTQSHSNFVASLFCFDISTQHVLFSMLPISLCVFFFPFDAAVVVAIVTYRHQNHKCQNDREKQKKPHMICCVHNKIFYECAFTEPIAWFSLDQHCYWWIHKLRTNLPLWLMICA